MVVRELENHPTLPDSKTIWRYLSLPQFLSILNRSELNFNRISSFDDEFEGTLPLPNVEALKEQASEHEGMDHERLLSIYKKYNKFTYANCWSIKDRPSSVMWRAYADFKSGIAIKSEYKKVRKTLNNQEKDIWLAPVEYIDHRTDVIPGKNPYRRYFYKNKLFSEEREFRAILGDPPVVYPEGYEKKEGMDWMAFSKNEEMPYLDVDNLDEYDLSAAKKVKIDVEEVIDQVYLSPASKMWEKDTLEDVISKIGYDLTVEIADREPVH